jgi:hypothetical protein
MSTGTTKVLAGCGVGCLLILMAIGGVTWMGYRWTKETIETVETAERAEAQLEEGYGRTRDFTPPLEGRIASDRMEKFLWVRETIAFQRAALTESVEAMAPVEGEGRTTSGLRAARAGIGLAPRILEHAAARNDALLEAEMGLGEYTWIYWLTYHAWLGHPVDESLLRDLMEARAEFDGSAQIHIDGMDSDEMKRELRRDVRAMLRNLESELAGRADLPELHSLVAAEVALTEADRSRVPWEDGLPEAFAAGLEPYRGRLQENYSPATNPFELLELGSGAHGITLE